MKIKLDQSSTWRGLALIASAVALTTGHGHLFSAEYSEAAGLSFGGLIGTAVPCLIGLYDTLRDEFHHHN